MEARSDDAVELERMVVNCQHTATAQEEVKDTLQNLASIRMA
jgi:hypothetical protein